MLIESAIVTAAALARGPAVEFDLSAADRWLLVDDEREVRSRGVSSVVLDDGRTVIAAYVFAPSPVPKIRVRRSENGGMLWGPPREGPGGWDGEADSGVEVPSLHLTHSAAGKPLLVMWSAGPVAAEVSVSEDLGLTWSDFRSVSDGLPASERWSGGVASMEVGGPPGRVLAFVGNPWAKTGKEPNEPPIALAESSDGGWTWGRPLGIPLHEPEVGAFSSVHSEDRRTVALLLSQKGASHRSHVTATRDEGRTWTRIEELPSDLTGRDYRPLYGPDHRLLLQFVELPEAPSPRAEEEAPAIWVGTFEDLERGREGLYKVRLNPRATAGGAPERKETLSVHPFGHSVTILADGTILWMQFVRPDLRKEPMLMAARFTLSELDAAAGVKPEGTSAGPAR